MCITPFLAEFAAVLCLISSKPSIATSAGESSVAGPMAPHICGKDPKELSALEGRYARPGQAAPALGPSGAANNPMEAIRIAVFGFETLCGGAEVYGASVVSVCWCQWIGENGFCTKGAAKRNFLVERKKMGTLRGMFQFFFQINEHFTEIL